MKLSQEEVAHREKEMVKVMKEYEDVFWGIGRYKGEEVEIQVQEGAIPVIQPPRRIPLQYRQPLTDHLEELLKEDVIEGPLTEEETGTWIYNLVITDKKWDKSSKEEGSRTQIRANLDLRPLNKYVYQMHEPIPTHDELRHQLQGSDTFSTL